MSPVEDWEERPASKESAELNPYRVLPEIRSPSQSGLLRERLLWSHEVTAQTALLPHLLVTGCRNGNLLLWDISKAMVEKL